MSTRNTKQTNRRFKEEWYTCARCGFQYPRSRVSVQNGLTLCRGPETVGCQDEPGVDAYRRRLDLPLERPIPELPNRTEDL